MLKRLFSVLIICALAGMSPAVDLLSLLSDGRTGTSLSKRRAKTKASDQKAPDDPAKVVVVERTNIVERIVEKPVVVVQTNIVEKPVVVERTNVVESIVVDKAVEKQWQERERQLQQRERQLQEKLTRLEEDYRKLVEEKTRIERVVPKEQRQFAEKEINITAKSVFYDRKQGYAAFDGNVFVDDREYQLCAKKAYVFTDQSNSVQRVVALENVAVTNGAKRAYGVKASYFRKSGMVILYGDARHPAVVRDESKVDDQTVTGDKIKFWINRSQVEVLKAHITAPVGNASHLKDDLLGQ